LSELSLAHVVERYELEPEAAGQVVLRAVREPWPFRPSFVSHLPALAAFGRARLAELEEGVEPSWRRRHAPKPSLRSLMVAAPNRRTSSTEPILRPGPRHVTEPEVWDDRAATDVSQLVALLFVAAEPLTRAELSKQLGIGQARLARVCALAGPLLGRIGLMLIVAYEQPVTRADISRIRGVDSDGVVASLLTRGLIGEERRFSIRGASLPLVTTAAFLCYLGLQSLAQMPALPHSAYVQP
jgi:hypothetical protein